jgi:trehalose 6-phosphate phosphatase
MTMPPPTPKSALKKPATSPIRTKITATYATRVALEAVTDAPEESAIFLDFDGVLAPIVDRPEDAYPPPETRDELARLCDRYALVAIVSGRAGEDVRARVDVDGVVYVGSHGLELDRQAERWRHQIVDFTSGAPWPPQETELKGLSVAFHFRHREDDQHAVLELEEIAERAKEEGLVPRFGRKVLEVLPPLAGDKGTAVRSLVERVGVTRALVAGDDTPDLDAFRAVDDLECAVRVAVVSPESPALLSEYAQIVVGSPAEFRELLKRL